MAVLGASGNKVWYRDANQIQNRTLAIGKVLAGLLGGEGIYTGGATLLAQIADGTDYPAFRACLYDDAADPEAWWLEAAAAVAMNFSAATIADATAYLVLTPVTGAATDMALGGRADFTIEVQPTADAAPEHSFPLGSGAVTSSAFTSWTPASCFVQVASGSRIPLTLLASLTNGDLLAYNSTSGLFQNSAQIATTQIANDAVTFAKLQNLTSDRLVGRDTAGSGDPEEISLGAGLGFTGSGGVQVQSSATDRVLGRSTAGAGAIEEIVCVAVGRTVLASSVALTAYQATSTIVGWADLTGANVIRYARIGNLVIVHYQLRGTSNSTSASFTLPFAAASIAYYCQVAYVSDNGVDQTSPGIALISSGGTTVTLYKTMAFGAWTGSLQKGAYGVFEYLTS